MKASDDLALELMHRAEEDLSTVQAMLGVAPIADAVVGLHAQQAVERALKAVLAAGQLEYPFTHDIDALAELCEAAGSTLPSELDEADLLTPYAVAARYNQAPQATVQREEAERFANVAVTWARQVVESELSGTEPGESP